MKMQRKQFRIGQLAQHLGVENFVVRFWEKEFELRPQRSFGGQRFYEQKDLEKFLAIKTLLYDEGFTIAGAKKQLKNKSSDIIASKKTTISHSDDHKDKSAFFKKIDFIKIKLIKLKQLL